MDLDYKAIGEKICKTRKKESITQECLRNKAGISKSHMSHIERGTTKVSLPTLVDIANALGTSVDYFLSDSVEASTHVFNSEVAEILKDCSAYECRAIIEHMKLTKKTIRNLPAKKEDYHD